MTASNQAAQPGPNDHKEARQRQAGVAGVRRSIRDTARVVDDNTVLNMTPMIDIVFQLIVFFLLTLDFTDLNQRIDCQLPKDRYTGGSPQPTEKIRIKLFRKHSGEPAAFTRIRIGNRRDRTIDLPAESGLAGEARRQGRRASMRRVRAWVRERHDALSPDTCIEGEIAAMPPTGHAVPHGDIMLALDALRGAGVEQVVFVGMPPPVSGRSSRRAAGHGED